MFTIIWTNAQFSLFSFLYTGIQMIGVWSYCNVVYVQGTVRCSYNAVQYVIILHTILQSQQQNISQTLYSQKVSIVIILAKIDRVITASHCTFMCSIDLNVLEPLLQTRIIFNPSTDK